MKEKLESAQNSIEIDGTDSSGERNEKDFDPKLKKTIKKEKIFIIFYTIFQRILSAIYTGIGLHFFLEYAIFIVLICSVVRLILLGRPIHKEAFPVLCIILTGIIPYLILTSGAKDYFKK